MVFMTSVYSIIFSNCTQEYVEDINGVCFEQEVLPIFQANCALRGCHKAIIREQGYSPMPKDGNKLPACDIAKIRKWGALGAEND